MHVAAFSDLLAALSRTAVLELPIPPDHTPGHEITVTPAGSKGNDEIPWRQQCDLAGFQNSAAGPDLGSYAARSYSLRRPPRTGRRWIRSLARSATG